MQLQQRFPIASRFYDEFNKENINPQKTLRNTLYQPPIKNLTRIDTNKNYRVKSTEAFNRQSNG